MFLTSSGGGAPLMYNSSRHLNPLGSPQTRNSTKGRGGGAHPGLDSFPTSHAECSAIVEVSALPMALFSITMITQTAVIPGYYSQGPAGQTVH